MQISILNPIQQTTFFTIILIVALLVSIRKKEGTAIFPISLTNELKGFAILAIVLSHIGYFLSTDTNFLFPLSIMAGVGVDLFLFLSGYGLMVSALRNPLTVWEFLKKRLPRLYIPIWITLGVFFILDFFLLHKTYTGQTIAKSFAGFFQSADIFNDVNSPLWFITLLLMYYILFPIVFSKRIPIVSSIILFLSGYFLIKINPSIFKDVMRLYSWHYIAFPLGVFVADISNREYKAFVVVRNWAMSVIQKRNVILSELSRYVCIAGLATIVGYFSLHNQSDKGDWIGQWVSVAVSSAILLIAILKPVEFKLFTLIGIYSFEVYLLHWPMMYRYDFLYRYMPAYIATALYVVLFVGIGYGFSLMINKLLISKKKVQAK